MALGKIKTKRRAVTFSAPVLRYLEELAKRGLHGSDVPGVARTLIEEGVRQAIKDGFIIPANDGFLESTPSERRSATLAPSTLPVQKTARR